MSAANGVSVATAAVAALALAELCFSHEDDDVAAATYASHAIQVLGEGACPITTTQCGLLHTHSRARA